MIPKPSKNILVYPRYQCCCDAIEEVEFDRPIILTVQIRKPGTIKIKTDENKKVIVEDGKILSVIK